MDCFALLTGQHQKLLELADRLAKASGSQRAEALEKLRAEIGFHFYLEETHVYTTLESYDGSLRAEIFSLWHDHDEIRRALDEFSGPQRETSLLAKCTELREALATHFRHEEQHVFPRARRLIGFHALQSIERNIQEELAGRKRAA